MYRTVWVSDTHLGSKGCQADKLLQLLQSTECDNLILVGDIIDVWALKRSIYWPAVHGAVVQEILNKASAGCNVVFIPGNHDEILRQFHGLTIGGVHIRPEYIHTLADGRRVLCIHGDQFDIVTRYHKWIAVAGDIGYAMLLTANRYFNKARAFFGMGYWSLSQFIKQQVKQAVNFIGDFEQCVSKEGAERGVDVVLCGHIHHAEIKAVGSITYVNCGDAVESCTAIAETPTGQLQIIDFSNDVYNITNE